MITQSGKVSMRFVTDAARHCREMFSLRLSDCRTPFGDKGSSESSLSHPESASISQFSAGQNARLTDEVRGQR